MLSSSSLRPCMLPSLRQRSYRSVATIINGTTLASQIKDDLRSVVCSTMQRHNAPPPGLAMILVGNRGDSMKYVQNKRKACTDIGVNSLLIDYPPTICKEELVSKIEALNRDTSIHGILIQLPLPPHLDEHSIINHIDPTKDVDGLTSHNIAKLTFRKIAPPKLNKTSSFLSTDFHISCTAQGCIEIIDKIGVRIEGKRAVVIGRSNIVGLPTALLLMQRNATVTIAHSRSENIDKVLKEADIVIVAIGKPEFLKGSWLKEGAVVIDVGINYSTPEGSQLDGRSLQTKLLGDAEFTSCKEVASFITPTPGGVGPMTVAMLLRNTVNSYHRSILS